MPSLTDRLSQALLAHRLIREDQLREALALHKAQGGSLQQILVEHGFVKEGDVLAAVSQELGIPHMSLSRMRLDPTLKALIPREMAVQYQLIPVARIGDTLTVGLADPLNLFALDALASAGLTIHPLLATQQEVEEAIEQYYGAGVEETIRAAARRAEPSAGASGPDEQDVRELLRQTQEPPVITFTNGMLTRAVRLHASDLLIEPREQDVRVRYRVDGVLQEGPAPPKPLHNAVVSRVKVLAELNLAERRVPQDGHFTFHVDEREVDFRVSILPVSFGGTVCLRVLDKGDVRLNIDTLGFAPRDLASLKVCAKRPHGMLLTTGPTGSGKTTTLYALLKLIDSPEKNLVTVEDPVEFELAGINQVQVRADIGLTFAKALRSILRQDPDVIMVGEIRDAETADMAVKAALTGHLVLSTLHTNSAAGSVVRLINMGIEPFLLNSCVRAVIGQRLVRKVCPRCRERYRPSRDVAEPLGLLGPDGGPVELVRGRGCRMCFQFGYAGREVIAETMVMTTAIRELVLRRAPEREVHEAARREGMQTLRGHGLAKAIAGITSLEEVFRTTIGEAVEA